MKFLEKMWLTIILKVTKNQGISLFLEDTFLEKPQGEGKIDTPSPSHSLLRLKYKAAPVGKTADAANNKDISVKTKEILVPLKYIRNFWRSLEMLLINCKIHLELNWIKEYILSSAGDSAKFEITDAKLHVLIHTYLQMIF